MKKNLPSHQDGIYKVNEYPFDISIPKPDIPVAGHLKYFKSNWYKITQDPHLLQMILACPIHVSRPFPSQTSVREIKMSMDENKAARDHIQELLRKKAIVPSDKTDGDFLSNVFLVPKKDGGFRMILNLKQFNKYVEKFHFKMETLQTILHLVSPHSWMTVLDLQDAYLVIPVGVSRGYTNHHQGRGHP